MTQPASRKVCRDCYPEPQQRDAARERGKAFVGAKLVTARAAPHPGPRCATHWRVKVRERKEKAHAAHVARTYSLDDREYNLLYQAQNGVCALCQRATGATRKLSVDHDHACCSGGVSCGYCVRGLLCRPCNDILGHARDDWKFFARAIKYLTHKPAAETVLKKRRTAPWGDD